MNNFRILHLIPSLCLGGAENSLIRIMLASDSKISEHVVCTFQEGVLSKKLLKRGIRVIHLRARGYFDVYAIFKLGKLLKELKPTVMVTYLPYADIVGRVVGKICGVSNIVCSIRNNYFKRFVLWGYLMIDLATSFLVSEYVSVSETVKKTYLRMPFFERRNITVIPNGIDVSIFQSFKKRRFRKKLIIFGTVSNLKKQKGVQYLIYAAGELKRETSDFLVWIVGDGPEKRSLDKLIRDLDLTANVKLLGRKSNILPYLGQIDCFVLTSLYEGMSNALLEAMACEKIVVVSDIEENTEIVIDGVNGYTFKSRDYVDLTKVLKKVINQRSTKRGDQIADKARDTVLERYSLKQVVNKWQNLLHKYAQN